LALIGGHAERSIAFQVLYGHEPFPMGESDVLGGNVVLIVDKALARRPDFENRRGFRPARRRFHARWFQRGGGSARGGNAGGVTFNDCRSGRKAAVECSGADPFLRWFGR